MKRAVVFLLVLAGLSPARAQHDSFESFRKGIKDDFSTFRKQVLDDYDKYLDGIWAEYNAFRGIERDKTPKPVKVPETDGNRKLPIVELPVPESVPGKSPEHPKSPSVKPVAPVFPAMEIFTFEFFGFPVQVPDVGLSGNSDIHTRNFGNLWRTFTEVEVAPRVIPALQRYVDEWNLNDWFVFELVRRYADSAFAGDGAEARISLTHYLLSHWGFNVRIGLENGERPILLVAIKQMVYARTFAQVDGQRYYLFDDVQWTQQTGGGCMFQTCRLPENAENGLPLDLMLYQDLTIPYFPHSYSFNYKDVKIEGELNANLMLLLYRYPQMPIGCYADSMVSQEVRDNVVAQLRRQLADMPRLQAINTLLQFVQHAFEYATDDEQHGFEKPYFFEEMLLYPQCDCEDRSIFYAYLLWHVLNVENHLIAYPGHESVAVCLDESFKGDSYRYEGKDYYISDPTFIGAVTGMCMPDYRTVKPVIDYVWRASK